MFELKAMKISLIINPFTARVILPDMAITQLVEEELNGELQFAPTLGIDMLLLNQQTI